MIVISLVLVIAAAVSLFIGLFVATETLTFIWGAIALCLVSLFLLWIATRQRKGTEPTSPSAPVYGGAARAGGSTTPARTGADEDLDALTSPDAGTVVRRTTARDRATRAASTRSDADDTVVIGGAGDETEPDAAPSEAPGAAGAPSSTPRKKAVTRRVPVKKASTTRVARKATTATSGTIGTTGAEARARLAQIAGVGPAKQDALLAQYGSLEGIRDASVDDIVANVRGFGEALATRVKRELG